MCKRALALVADLLDCGFRDAQEVLRLVELHGGEVVQNARETAMNAGRPIDFPAIVGGVQRAAIKRMAADDSDLRSRLHTVAVSGDYQAWGGVEDPGEASQQEAEELAHVMMRGIKSHG